MWKSLILVAATCVFPAILMADSCVRIRDSGDSYKCMNFSAEELKTAQGLGLHLGMPYAAVWQRLVGDGWLVEQKWLELFDYDPSGELPICGQGYDAICHLVLRRGETNIELVFSGTNESTSLISAHLVDQ